ncbi:hypothetical protein L0V05_20070 [Tabrizicola sp. J26]|uniref:TadE/TadG family type IV pilus assembly protein n=1 Tax=Alitabrizicola rongguiensis TaxID=2909234 RepID=UPI001F30B24E|nr:pilus assembly protein TadG-related protein [Tabrizicola rongguiensis]MCF1711110.1 hypothetical protein [Tabrizicola rongguiensis]
MAGPKASLGAARRFGREEAGAGTVFALFGITICLMLAGMAVDYSNAWRQREILRLSADVAAHAGAGILARGGTAAGAMVAANTAIELNTPKEKYGRVLYDAIEDIRPFHYDLASNREMLSGPINAISVRLERNERVRNPVPTFLLRLIGQDDWNIAVESVSAVVPTERCQSSEGVFAHGQVTLSGKSMVGKEVCLHSQKFVALQQPSSFAADAGLSMPDMGRCVGFCDDSSSPGYDAAAASVNLVMPETAAFIQELADSLGDPKKQSAAETEFFAAHPLAGDLAALDELGVDTTKLKTGDVVPLSATLFQRARSLPAGLVYNVTCGTEEGAVLRIGLSAEEEEAALMAPDSMSAEEMAMVGEEGVDGTLAKTVAETAADRAPEGTDRVVIAGSVLLSNCAFHFTPTAEIRDALLISTRTGLDAVLTAAEGAVAGDEALACRASRQSVIMALGSMTVPAGFTASNASFVVAGSVRIGGLPEGQPALHRGLAIHSGAEVQFAGAHSFDSCGSGSATLLPTLDVIKYVIPTQTFVSQ